ncbi:MAG: urate hydroxylase PuuD [Rhodothalassiaceae bacterium]
MTIDWLFWGHLLLRWFHVIAGIAWIGASFYFVWLDNNLRKAADGEPGVAGELWAVHGGGFYRNRKYLVAPERLPERLHWFKYEAYMTWLSGFLLLGLLYYHGATLYLIDPAKAALGPLEASAIGLGALIGGWLLYDGLCRSPLGRHDALLGALWFLILIAMAYGLLQVFSGRGAFIHVGAIIGTAMVGNVFFVIIPNQKKTVAAMMAGSPPDPRLGQQAKQRSVHNNYMTLPVVFLMVSNHFPATYSGEGAFLILAGLSLASLPVRHFFNLRHKDISRPGLVLMGAAILLATIVFASWSEAERRQALGAGTGQSWADVGPILARHCVVCHATVPTHEAFDAPPAGVVLESEADLVRFAARVKAQAVDADIMPLGNETGMTMEERAKLGAYIAALGSRE